MRPTSRKSSAFTTKREDVERAPEHLDDRLDHRIDHTEDERDGQQRPDAAHRAPSFELDPGDENRGNPECDRDDTDADDGGEHPQSTSAWFTNVRSRERIG